MSQYFSPCSLNAVLHICRFKTANAYGVTFYRPIKKMACFARAGQCSTGYTQILISVHSLLTQLIIEHIYPYIRRKVKMPKLNENERITALTLLASGASVTDVAARFNCNRKTIVSLRERFHTTGSVGDRPRSGRPRVTDVRTDRAMTLAHLRNRFKTATSTAREYGISYMTVLNRLRNHPRPIRPRRCYVGQFLLRHHRRARMLFARRHRRWNRVQWARVIFSDESRFRLQRSDGRVRVYRRKGERFTDACVVERDRFGGGSVMVWGGIMGGHKTELVIVNGNLNAQEYVNQILQPVLIPFIAQHGPAVFMHDNARPHTARVTRQFLQQNNVVTLEWPSLSPDMNPIEHLWDELDHRVRTRGDIHNMNQLAAALVQEWNALPRDRVQRYVRSMRRRVATLRLQRGGHTRY